MKQPQAHHFTTLQPSQSGCRTLPQSVAATSCRSLTLHLAACSAALAITATAAPPPVPLNAPEGPQVATLQSEASPSKPYVAQLFAPGEKPVPLLDDSPPDHFHHHGLMLALGADKTDFWTEKGAPNIGTQKPLETKRLPNNQGTSQIIRWLSHENKNLLDEVRVIRVLADKEPAVNWLVWNSMLTPAAKVDSVELNGRHYFGLGMRFLPPFANTTRFSFLGGGEARVVRGDERLTPARACAATASVDGKPVTLVMFDHKENPRPALWFTMSAPFSYLSATQGLMDKPQSLAKGKTWNLRYGIAIVQGDVDQARLQTLETRWLQISTTP
jgi:hypothetical protein